MRVSFENEPRRAALLQALTDHPLVAIVAAQSRTTRGAIEDVRVAEANRLPVDQLAVSSEYFEVLGIDVVSGRGFTPAERTAEAGVVVVSETIARQLWPNGDGVGQRVRLDAPQPASPGARASSADARSAKVVGVAHDHGRRRPVRNPDANPGACTCRPVSRRRRRR